MRATIAGIFLTLSLLAGAGTDSRAQMTTEDVIDPGPRDEAVERAISRERSQVDVKYIRPDADFRAGEDIQIKIPDKPESPEEVRQADRTTSGVLAFLLIAGVIVVLVLFGNRINVSFGKTSEEKRKARAAAEREGRLLSGVDLPRDGILEHLAKMADRRRALILLTGLALERAAKLNGLTLARAQTARDVLRILPRQWPHMGAMRQLVRQAEIVHFGGRDLAEDAWQGCLDAARPIFAGQEGSA